MTEQESKLRELVSMPCPHCDGTLTFCEDEDADAVIIHTLPFCAWFEEATIDDLHDALDSNAAAKYAVETYRTKKPKP
jgi:hypothetical protein